MLILSDQERLMEIQKFLSTYKSAMSGNNGISEKFNIDITTELLDISENDGATELIFIYNRSDKKGRHAYIEDEAHNLILSFERRIISRTFPKIHEAREAGRPDYIKWDTAESETYLDGTHVSVFKHNKVFFIRAWSKNPNLNDTIENCVKDILTDKHYPWFSPFDANKIGNSCCWTFEFVSPKFKNIVEYKEPRLYLLTMFNKDHGFECNKEFTDNFALQNGFDRLKRTKVVSFGQVHSMVDSAATLDKGLIISDSDKHRIKVINPIYKIIDNAKSLKNKPSVSDLAKLVLLEYQSHIASTCNEYSTVIKLLEEAVGSLLKEADTVWNVASEAKSRKEFADRVTERPISSLLFEWYKRKAIHKNREVLAKFIKPRYVVHRAKARNVQKFMAALSDAEIDREYKIKHP